MIDVAPKVGILEAHAAQPLSFKTALAEWIDNALDADATHVAIEFGKSHRDTFVAVRDDGNGTANPERMVTLGDHSSHASTRLGRYGIGAKDAALWIGGTRSSVRITTVHNGKRRVLDTRWEEISAAGWQVNDPVLTDAVPGERGTTLTVTPIVRAVPMGKRWDELRAELGYLYSPALKAGKQITLRAPGLRSKPELIERWRMPPLENVIDTSVVVAGKRARVYCGIVAAGHPNPRSGITYMHGFRVIISATSRGCGTHSIARVCGFVELDGSWKLAKNKDGIVADEDELYRAVESACLPVLTKASALGAMMHSHAFESAVADAVNSMLGNGVASGEADAKARRRKGDTEGTADPKQTGRRHRRAEREQDGSTFISRGRRSGVAIRIEHEHYGHAECLGEVKDPSIILNLDHPLIAAIHSESDVRATAIIVMHLLASDACLRPSDGRQLRIRGLDNSSDVARNFMQATASLLGKPLTIDGRQAVGLRESA